MLALAASHVAGELASGSEGRSGGLDQANRNLGVLALGLVVLSSLLVIAAALPPGVARTRLTRHRESLALAAIGILASVMVLALLVAVT
jgi:hypothetical protein